jgi:hypothetical protein
MGVTNFLTLPICDHNVDLVRNVRKIRCNDNACSGWLALTSCFVFPQQNLSQLASINYDLLLQTGNNGNNGLPKGPG